MRPEAEQHPRGELAHSHTEAIRQATALYPRLRRFAFGLCSSLDGADELVQAAFERALSSLQQWQPGTRVDSWMYKIIQNLWLNQCRSDRVRGRHLPSQEPDLLPCFRSEDTTERELLLDRVQRCINTLPPDQRLAVLLVTVEGLPYREAASVLDITEAALTSRLSRGRHTLLQKMQVPIQPDIRSTGVRKAQ